MAELLRDVGVVSMAAQIHVSGAKGLGEINQEAVEKCTRNFRWGQMERMADIPWHGVSIRHPWPDKRFAVKYSS